MRAGDRFLLPVTRRPTKGPHVLTADEVSDIARAAGLGMADAVALRALADDTETATRIAAKFAATDATPDKKAENR